MNDLDRRLKEMLERRADDAGHPRMAARKVIRRVRVRQAVSGLVAASVIGIGAILIPQVMTEDAPRLVQPVKPPIESPALPDILPGEFELGDDPSTEKRVEVAVGEREDVTWTLYIYKQEGVWCESFAWDGDAGGCPVSVPRRKHVSPGRSGGETDTDVLTARLAPDVARVEVRLDGGPPIEVPVIQGPEQVDENFMVAFVPKGTSAILVVFDNDGNELQREPVAPSNADLDEYIEEIPAPNEPSDETKGCLGVRVTILGTDGDDVLEGTPKHDVISGLGGDDTITGVDGDDVVCGGEGNDEIDLGPGFDQVIGGPGDDTLNGGVGTDSVAYWTSAAGVRVDLDAGVGRTEELGERDVLVSVEILGGSNHDDVIEGGDGDDQIEGGPGDDVFYGRGGDDLFYGEEGADEYDGGPGRDYLGFDLIETALQIDLGDGRIVGDEIDRITLVEVVEGGSGDDTILGSDLPETLIGAEGNDIVHGGGGDDILWGDYRGMTAKSYRSGGMVIQGTDDSLDGDDGSDELNGGPGDNTCTSGERMTDC